MIRHSIKDFYLGILLKIKTVKRVAVILHSNKYSTYCIKNILETRENPIFLPCSIISTRLFRCGRIAHPIKIAICCTILMPVCLACHDFLLRQTAFKKGSSEGIPNADATTANALAVVLRTYSSMLSISGLIVEIIVANPAALAKLEMISRPSTRA